MAAGNNRIAVVWSDNSAPVGGDTNGYAVYMRLFSNDGQAIVNGTTSTNSDFRVNVSTALNQIAPKVTALANGDFLVTWVSDHAATGFYDVYMQRYSGDGVRLGPAVDHLVTGGAGFAAGSQQGARAATNSEMAQQQDVMALAGGGWVITYVNNNPGVACDVLANIYDAAGNLVRAQLPLASVAEGANEFYPTLAALPNGGFVASWTSTTNTVLGSLPGGDTSGLATYMRYFDESGHVRSFSEFEPGGNAVVIESGLIVGGSTNSDTYNADRKAADPTFDIAADGLSAHGDTVATLWKAEVNILNYQPGDMLQWNATTASMHEITVNDDGAGHLVMTFGVNTTLNGIEAVLRSVSYAGGATPAAGDRAIEFVLVDKAGSRTTQESGVTVESRASAVYGTAGNDILNGGNGHDGIIGLGGIDTLNGGNGDDHIYVQNPLLNGQYSGGQGTDTLVLDMNSAQSVNLGQLVAGHAQGFERIDLGTNTFKSNSMSLNVDSLASITSILDPGVNRLLVQGLAGSDTVNLASSMQMSKVAVTSLDTVKFDIWQAAGSDIQLWLQQGMTVSQF